MKTAIAFGTFDGVHIAHRKVLDLPKTHKRIAVTFLQPPKMYTLNSVELLMTFEQKTQALKELGFDEIYPLDFEKVKNAAPIDFLQDIFEKYNPTLISCGFDYRFGKDAKGDVSLLSEFCKKNGITLKVCDAIEYEGNKVSSTMIRNLLKQGEIEKANSLLCSPFSFSATVFKGDKRGRTIGFPTINQKYPQELVKIKFGVYKTKVLVDGEEYSGVTDIGLRPTYETDYVISETFIKDFSGDLYGKEVKIIPLQFIREEMKFSSLDELKKQIQKDIT